MTDNELSFLKIYLRTNSLEEASKTTGISKKDALQLMEKPEIKEQLNLAHMSSLITEQYILGNLKKIADISMANEPIPHTNQVEYDPSTAIRSLELLGKNQRLFTDRIEALQVQTSFEEYVRNLESDDEF